MLLSARHFNQLTKRANKFGAKRTPVDGHTFDSKAEAKRYSELKLLQRAKEIWGLLYQRRYELMVNGIHICTYVADFTYYEGKKFVCEDVKGARTRDYIIKKKLMKAIYGIDVVEIRA